MGNVDCMYCRFHHELMNLRRENEGLKNGREFQKLRGEAEQAQKKAEKFEAKYNERQSKLTELVRKNTELRSGLNDAKLNCVILRNRIRERDQQIAELPSELENARKESAEKNQRIAFLQKQLEEKQARIEDLEGLVTKLKAQAVKDFHDSSKPSSMSPNHKKIVPNSRVSTGRKPGGQKGHKGHGRPRLKPTAAPVYLPEPDEAVKGGYHKTGRTRIRYLVELHMDADVIPFVAQEYKDPKTGKRIWSQFGKDMPNEVNYGDNIKALACLLNNYDNVSVRRTSETIRALTGGKVNLSTGFISSLPALFSRMTQSQMTDYFRKLQSSPFMHADFTNVRVNGKNMNVLITSNNNTVLYTFKEHKGDEGLKDTPVDGYCFVLIHDHDITFYHYGENHQECIVHISRYLIGSAENEPELTWAKKMHDLFAEMLKDAYAHTLTDEKADAYRKRYDEILDLADQEYTTVSAAHLKYYPDGKNLAKRLRKYKDETLFFLDHRDIEPDNNEAERDARKVRRKAHEVGSFRSEESVQDYCWMLSMIVTGQNKGKNVFQTLTEGFRGIAPPEEKPVSPNE